MSALKRGIGMLIPRPLQPSRGIRIFQHQEPSINQSQPDTYRLPTLPKVPTDQLASVVKWPKGTKDLYRFVGQEEVHNQLIVGQYAVVAVSGGAMTWKNYESVKLRINRYLNADESFAIMRIDPPYKPVTSKGGKRMGGGKGSVKTYRSVVKAGRVIFEIGGKVQWDQVQPWLSRMANLLPFEAMAVNQELLDRLNTSEGDLEKANLNPMTIEWFLRNNILDCQRHFSPYDIKLMGKFTYKDRHNNKMWNLTRESGYKSKS